MPKVLNLNSKLGRLRKEKPGKSRDHSVDVPQENPTGWNFAHDVPVPKAARGIFIFQAPLTPENPRPPRRFYGLGIYYEMPCTGCGDRHRCERWTQNKKSCVRCVKEGLQCSHATAPRPNITEALHADKSRKEDALRATLDLCPPTSKARVHCGPVESSATGAAPARPIPSSSDGNRDEILEELRALDVEKRSSSLFGSLRFQLKWVDELAATTAPTTCKALQKCTRKIGYKADRLETLFIENT
ncbi:hypothetical protein B0H19DRAFT_1161979 [Mycena capillaripes]|nr:hypothetical protein B0H19DRAFT_1161979 [Mycena capillaripes]